MSAPGKISENVPRVSVIIPAFKRPELLRKAVVSLFGQDLDKDDYEIIVVDSSPDEETVCMLAELQKSAPCSFRFYHKEPEGPGPSRNLGVQHAQGEFIAFMDSDCQATSGWLKKGMAAFEGGVGLVQGRVAPDPNGRLGVFTWFVTVEKEGFVYECANIFYRRKVFEEAGGFPGHVCPNWLHPPGGEDVDLAWRVKRGGWATRFASDALVYHEVIPIPISRWLVNEQLYLWPHVLKKFPELRRFFFARFFYDRSQAFFVLALVGVFLLKLTPVSLALCLPYVVLRISEPSRTLRGVLRLLRVLVYVPRDTISLLVLLAGSLRYRSLLL